MPDRADIFAVVPAQAGTHSQQPFDLSCAVHNDNVTAYGSPLAPGRQWSIATARHSLAGQFRKAGLDTPELDARVLIGHALGLDHATLAAQPERRLTEPESAAVAGLARRRLAREPVARILGVKEFWGMAFRVNADTLVPRPETETLVEAALAILGPDRDRAWCIADLGTGSGVLLLSLLSELPHARGVGTDLSTGALACARANAKAFGLVKRSAFVVCDQGAALARRFDLVVANPPYVARPEIASLQPEVRDFDPARALDGGPDGLAAYRAIISDARRLLSPNGSLLLELGAGLLDPVMDLSAAAGLCLVEPPRKDLAGIARALCVKVSPQMLSNA
jgi:release factor glutamine methyltransferase